MGRIVITGSSGLVATSVIEYVLNQTKHDLVLIDRKPPESPITDSRVQYRTLDLTDPEVWAEPLNGANALIHLAALAQPWHASAQVTHHTNVQLSYNALCAAVNAGINRVVLAGSINAIGGAWNKEMPQYDYFPIDEQHQAYPVETYSLSKYIAEVQADSICRTAPNISVATLRFHYVVPPSKKPSWPDEAEPAKGLWGWTSDSAAARACLLALEMGDERRLADTADEPEGNTILKSIKGHQVFFIVANSHCCPGNAAMDIGKRHYPSTEFQRELAADQGFYDCSKAQRLLGWEHDGGLDSSNNW